MLFFIKRRFAGRNQRVQLRYHERTLSNRTELPSDQFIHKVAEGIVLFLFGFWLLNRKLKLALYFPHEEIYNHYVVSWIVKFIFYHHNFELILHDLAFVHNVHGIQQTNKCAFFTFQFRPHQVVNPKAYQIYSLLG
jgi:hypothetical protein